MQCAAQTFVVMHSGIVNRYQLLCDACTVLCLNHIGELWLFSFFTHKAYVRRAQNNSREWQNVQNLIIVGCGIRP